MKLVLICEGSGDDADLRAIAWNVLRATHDWLADFDTLEGAGHAWHESTFGERHVKWGDLPALCDRLGVPKVQRLGGGQAFRASKRAMNLLLRLPDLDLTSGVRVVIAHDADGDDSWREGMHRARDEWLRESESSSPRPDVQIALGVAQPEHEAWRVAVFEPSDAERAALLQLARELGFDPTREPHQLRSGRSVHVRDAKRVLGCLVPDSARREALLRDAPVDALRARGGTCGLAEFVDELSRLKL